MELQEVKGGRKDGVGLHVQCPIDAFGSKLVSLECPCSLASLANISVLVGGE